MSTDKETLAAYAAKIDDYVRMTDEAPDDPQLAAFIGALLGAGFLASNPGLRRKENGVACERCSRRLGRAACTHSAQPCLPSL